MRSSPPQWLRHWLGLSWVRFLVVGSFGEVLYLGLYALVWRAGGRAVLAIAVAGGICLMLNAVLHARFSFRVPMRFRLLLVYVAIQLACLGMSLAVGWGLERLGVSAPGVALITLVLWSGTSFLLTRRSYRQSSPGT